MTSSLKNNRKQNKLVKQMDILLVLLLSLVFVLAFIIVPCYESEIRNLSKNPRNNVHFYVARDKEDNLLWLYFGNPTRSKQVFTDPSPCRIIRSEKYCSKYGLDVKDYANLKWEDEPVEVFLNLED